MEMKAAPYSLHRELSVIFSDGFVLHRSINIHHHFTVDRNTPKAIVMGIRTWANMGESWFWSLVYFFILFHCSSTISAANNPQKFNEVKGNNTRSENNIEHRLTTICAGVMNINCHVRLRQQVWETDQHGLSRYLTIQRPKTFEILGSCASRMS